MLIKEDTESKTAINKDQGEEGEAAPSLREVGSQNDLLKSKSARVSPLLKSL